MLQYIYLFHYRPLQNTSNGSPLLPDVPFYDSFWLYSFYLILKAFVYGIDSKDFQATMNKAPMHQHYEASDYGAYEFDPEVDFTQVSSLSELLATSPFYVLHVLFVYFKFLTLVS